MYGAFCVDNQRNFENTYTGKIIAIYLEVAFCRSKVCTIDLISNTCYT
jgi:hypothetical protein